MSSNITFPSMNEYIEYIGDMFIKGMNKLHSLNHMRNVIDFYDTDNIISDNPEIWNHYSANWKAIIQTEIFRYEKYLTDLKQMGDGNPQIKEKIKEVEQQGAQKPTLYAKQADLYNHMTTEQLNEKKKQLGNIMHEAIYNYDLETYIKYDTECLYISKLIDERFYQVLLQKQILNIPLPTL